MMKFWNAASWSNLSAQMPAMSPSVARIRLPSSANSERPQRVRRRRDFRREPQRHHEHAQADDESAHHCRHHVCGEEIARRQRRQQHEDQVAGDLGLRQRRRRVGEAVLQHRHHHQPRDQERRVGHLAVEYRDPRRQHMREDQQVEERGEDRRRDGLEAHLPEAQHFLVEQRRPPMTAQQARQRGLGSAARRRTHWITFALCAHGAGASDMMRTNACSRSVSVSASSSIAMFSWRSAASRSSSSA